MEAEPIDETIIIVKHPGGATMFKFFSCKTVDKVIFEEKLFSESRVWYISDIIIYGHIACKNSDILKDDLYAGFSKDYAKITNDWVFINVVDLGNKIKRIIEKRHKGAILSIIKKPEKKQVKRRVPVNNNNSSDSDSDSG